MKRFLLFTLLLAFTASAFEFTGKVVGVADGDTITVLAEGNKQHKVRLQHIDCPESRQPFGSKAKQFLSQKVFGKSVTVKWDEMDRYKRILGNVYLGEEWLNFELVWSKSTMQIAKEFWISDVAIAKRCKKVGVEKPPRGFWNKVEAGKIPHPQGKPVQP